MAYLTIRIKGEEGYSRSPLDKDRITVGRSSSAGITVRSNSLSREHLVLIRDGEGDITTWLIEDLDSANGTRVNDTKVEGKVALLENDVIKAGAVRLTFHSGDIVHSAQDKNVRGQPLAPVVKRQEYDPKDAAICCECARWYSVAHRLAGDRMPCPHCGKAQTVPEFAA